ncbi:pollen-specific leucine-rich repeat extensin-like protein 4 [Iris pallida]|uniref:Pollen-specific leucine-rich repeat extensin-like protein 4 n=1 Tax=Iris pallida TaxID=29817 RepID=A0AAX6I748_IRIPA|nr:pollen-specific leucine-rich repeat extensin-like protein 4 [Iris pallida]
MAPWWTRRSQGGARTGPRCTGWAVARARCCARHSGGWTHHRRRRRLEDADPDGGVLTRAIRRRWHLVAHGAGGRQYRCLAEEVRCWRRRAMRRSERTGVAALTTRWSRSSTT